MDSPLTRIILASLGGYLIILLFISVYDWIIGEYPRRSAKPPNSERIHYPFYHQEVANALKRFYRLIEKKHFVIPNTNSLHPRIYELFQMFNQETLEKYRSLVVFRI